MGSVWALGAAGEKGLLLSELHVYSHCQSQATSSPMYRGRVMKPSRAPAMQRCPAGRTRAPAGGSAGPVLFPLAGTPGCGGRALRARRGAGEGDVSAAAGAHGAAAMVGLSDGSALDPHRIRAGSALLEISAAPLGIFREMGSWRQSRPCPRPAPVNTRG